MAYLNDKGVIAPLDRFGPNDDDFNLDIPTAAEGHGYPGIGIFASALSMWASLQPSSKVTVGAAAAAFYCTPDIIKQAVEYHYWMCWDATEGPLENWIIGHDGE